MISTFSPQWFFGFDVAFELAFAIVAFIVSMLAFSIYKKTSQKNLKYFGISFMLISFSYVMQSVLNFLIISRANQQICQAMKIYSINRFNLYGALIHVIFMICGLVILVYTIFKTDNPRLLIILILISLLGIIYSRNTLASFYLFSTIYLLFLTIHFASNYFKNKQIKTLLIALAFLFLLFGSFHFLISVNHQLFYVIGHLLELAAYILILANLYLILKK